jgi:hypothetical protein
MKRFLIAFSLLVSIVSYSQSFQVSSLIEPTNKNGEVKGLIIDNEAINEPLAFVDITVKETSYTTTSDIDGTYSIHLKPGIYTLEFSFIGYKTIEIKEVVIEPNKTATYSPALSPLTMEETLVASQVD